MTGISFLSGEVTAKRLELLRELVPAATRVAVLVDPANATYAEITVRETGAAARSIGLQIQVLKASTQSVEGKIMGVSFAAKQRRGSTRRCSAAWSRCAH